ncbi:GEVED domain-containing protein [Mangrovivirga cuniculi]|nr:GEVED domain-containing protein [Mangrovivirga cuniculi]
MAVLIAMLSFYSSAQPSKYDYSLEGGTVNNHGSISPNKATMLIGGAEAGASGEIEATTWFLNNAAGGDYLVIRTGGTGGQAAWVWNNFSSLISSAAELSIDSRKAANDASVAQYIYDAEAIFIAGGDQTSYVENWKDTEVETALNYVINVKGIPISGTSAGMAILGSSYYAPASTGVLSSEILNDPYNNNMTNSLFYDDFLDIPYLSNVITDTHLDRTHGSGNENRYGRVFGFLARSVNDQNSLNRYAIGCEEGAFVCIDSNGIAKVFGSGNNNQSHAYFLQVNCQAPETVQSGSPLVWNNSGQAVKVYQIPGSQDGSGNSFDLNNWTTASGGGWMDWFTTGGYSGFNFINGSGTSTGATSPSGCSGNPEECTAPSSLNSSNITSNSVTISWAATNANSYDLQYRESSSSIWSTINTTSTSENISGLSSNTIYEYRVRSICSSTTSVYSAIDQFSTLSEGGGTVNYCTSSGSSTQYEYIDEVAIDNTSNISGNDSGYGDYTNFTFNLNAGSSHTMYIYPQTSDREIIIAWIDFNQDGDFTDANEEVLYAQTRRRARGTISIPSDAKNGTTRMRVSMKYANDGAPTSCENFQYGEVEDYIINISGGSTARITSSLESIPSKEIDFKKEEMIVYPNPSKGKFSVNISQDELVEIVIHNITGEIIMTQKKKSIDLSHVKAGVYFMTIKTTKRSQVIRLVKKE